MVRVWRAGFEGRSERIQGVVVHLGSGRQITFSDTHPLIRFLTEAGDAERAAPGPAPPSTADEE